MNGKNKYTKNQSGSMYLVVVSIVALLLAILLGFVLLKQYQQKNTVNTVGNTAIGNELVIKELNTKLDLSDAPYKDLSYAMVGYDNENSEKYSALIYSETLMQQALQEANSTGAAYTKEDMLVSVEHKCNMWAYASYNGDDGDGDVLDPASASADRLSAQYNIRSCYGTSEKTFDDCAKLAEWVTQEIKSSNY